MDFKKIEESISLIKKTEKLALNLNQNGFYLGFSGGKDSLVCYDLLKKANVKFIAVYNVTGIDPPENVYYIRENFDDVKFSFPKESFFSLIARKGLPSRQRRYCCELLKENTFPNCVAVLGIRKDESAKRSSYDSLVVKSKNKENRIAKNIDEMTKLKFQCVSGNDSFNFYPILEWSEKMVWDYIKYYNLPVNPCYKQFDRVGCMICPFASKRKMLYFFEQYPKFKDLLLRKYKEFLKKRNKENLVDIYIEWFIDGHHKLQYFFEKSKQLNLFK